MNFPSSVSCPICKIKALPFCQPMSFEQPCDSKRDYPGEDCQFYRCPNCELLFAFPQINWTMEDFKTKVYNEDYIKYDPDFVEARPVRMAEALVRHYPNFKNAHLDFGGGNGRMSEILCTNGWDSHSWDPFYENQQKPSQRFDLVTAFEVLEHSTDLLSTFGAVSEFMNAGSVFFATTLVYDPNVDLKKWFYTGPRNGHLSHTTAKTLSVLGGIYGLRLVESGVSDHKFVKV